MASDGTAETTWIMAQLTPLCEGQVWEVAVPDDHVLLTFPDEKVKPYIIVSVATPFSSNRDRGIGQDEDQQPHIMSSSVKVFGGTAESVSATMKEVRSRLIGKAPSASSTQLRVTGGFAYPGKDGGSVPTRFSHTLFLRNTVNLAS